MKLLPLLPTLLAAALAAELPVREVILYKHGVGFFGRAGTVPAGDRARLDFQASEMNDVLKSLVITDRTGQPVRSIRYDSSEPLQKKLGAFPFRIEGQVSLAVFLDQMKGARVELKRAEGVISGIVLSARVLPVPPHAEQLVLVAHSGDLQTIDLSAVSSIRFADLKLQDQLKEYLAAMNQSRSRDKRGVTIETGGDTRREIAASYMTPASIWKSSYRLLFGDQAATLEGWAIIDNTSGEDWDNVRLALVSGRPISFVSPLYEPRYRERPIADVFDGFGMGPVLHAANVANAPPPPVLALREKASGGRQAQMQFHQNFAAGKEEAESRDANAASTVVPTAEARELGELFEYRFSQPVTVKKGESAMLPFLAQKINARKLIVFSESMGLNPMNAAEVVNSSGKTLDGGPITVFDEGAYAGEALVETFKAGDKRLVSFGIDLGSRIATAFESGKEFVRDVKFRRGVLTTRSAFQETKTYTIRNVDARAKTLIIEHPKRPSYELVAMKPTSTTASAWRFEVTVKPESVDKFTVTEERMVEQSHAVTNLTPDVLLSYTQNKSLPPAAKLALEQLAAQKKRVADLTKQLADSEAELRGLTDDENRIRQNIHTLNSVTGQREMVQKYSAELVTISSSVAAARDRVGSLRKQKSAAENAVADTIDKLEL